MSYQVLARKWRPQVFDDLVGQQTVTQTLKNAIAENRIAHAFLFSGPRGVGKTTCARVLAKALNCHQSPGPTVSPCNECPSCQDIAASRSMDVLEIDGASNRGIDEVRELRESAKYQPIRDRFRIFIIDEVHMLTMEAFNALLKILEEPPPHVFFIFATTEQRKVPATIVSRCQMFDFKRIPDRILVQRLQQIVQAEGIEISGMALEMIASASEGGLRDALGTLDQIVAFSGQKVADRDVESVLGLVDVDVLIELAGAIARGEAPAVIGILDRISEYGVDYKVFYNELLDFYRKLFLIRISSMSSTDERLKETAFAYEEIHLMRICHQLVSLQNQLRLAGNVRFLFEVTLVKLARMKQLVPLEELAESLKKNNSLPTVLSRPAVAPAASVASAPGTKPLPQSGNQPKKPVSISDDFLAELIIDLESLNPRLAAAMENAAFVLTESAIRFYIPEMSFSMVNLNPKDHQDLESLMAQKLGQPFRVEIHRGEPSLETPVQRMATPETLVQSDPVVQEFVKAFQGKINRIELNKGSRGA